MEMITRCNDFFFLINFFEIFGLDYWNFRQTGSQSPVFGTIGFPLFQPNALLYFSLVLQIALHIY